MATPGTLTEAIWMCTVCHDVCSDIKTLVCGHSVCVACLISKTTTASSTGGTHGDAPSVDVCPHCQTSNNTEEVAEGTLVETLIEADQDEGAIVCSVCTNQGEITNAVKWCKDCNEALCAKCLDLHQKYPKFRHHSTTSLTESMTSDTVIKCTEHIDEDLKLFCVDCDIAVCHLCCSVSHRKCDSVVTLSEACLAMREALTVKADGMKADLAKTQSLVTEKNQQLKQLTESSDVAQEQLESNCNTFIQAVEDIKTSLKNRIVQQTDAGARALTQDIVDADSLCTTIRKDCHVIESDMERGHTSTIYRLYQKFCHKDRSTDAGEVEEKDVKSRVIEVNFKSNIHEVTQSLKQKYVGVVRNVFDKPKVPGMDKVQSEPSPSTATEGKRKKEEKEEINKANSTSCKIRY